jgi:hypothetical protein
LWLFGFAIFFAVWGYESDLSLKEEEEEESVLCQV